MYGAIFALDPGLRTGYAQWETARSGNKFKAGICDPDDACDIMERWANEHAGRNALMISESFHITEETAHKDQAAMGWPLELLGVCRYLARGAALVFDTQSPSDMKAFATEYKLRRYGFWTPGREAHARDAAGHLLYGLIARGMTP